MTNKIRMTSNRKQVVADIEAGTNLNAKTAALYAQLQIQRTLTGQRSGKEYTMSKSGKPHIASAPGEAPAVRSGDLRGSISTAPSPTTKALYYVGSDKEYAPHLELGTKHMRPRPFFVETINRALAEIRAKLTKRID